jgi:tetratricopeptide (TPR) repeat protein
VILQELGDSAAAAHTMDSLGYIHRHLGDRRQAVACYLQARDLFREVGQSEGEADSLTYIGDIHYDNGDVDAARHSWRQALNIYGQLDHPRVEHVRAKLAPVPALRH